MIRKAIVAGRFYPGNPAHLREMVGKYRRTVDHPLPALGIMAPHAGYIYSGAIAGEVYSCLPLPARVIILGPNHTGLGTAASIMSRGSWETPLGAVEIDEPLAGALRTRCTQLQEDETAHRFEHSIEVQLPFLQIFRGEFRFVPISLMTHNPDALQQIGRAIAKEIRLSPEPILLVASSDMTHMEPQARARQQDMLAIEQIRSLDPEGLLKTVRDHRISMCGVAPMTALLHAVNALGAKTAELVRYATSGDVSGDRDAVVGYAGIVIR